MLLVISYNGIDGNPRSTITVYDFLDGRKDYFCKSVIAFKIKDARWNPYYNVDGSDEFVTISDQKYHYWRIDKTLNM